MARRGTAVGEESDERGGREELRWEHPRFRGDKALVFATLGVVLLMAATMPVRPFLLASHPTLLSAAAGSLSAIGAGAAFARVGNGALWLVVAAGTFGMIKFDWLAIGSPARRAARARTPYGGPRGLTRSGVEVAPSTDGEPRPRSGQ